MAVLSLPIREKYKFPGEYDVHTLSIGEMATWMTARCMYDAGFATCLHQDKLRLYKTYFESDGNEDIFEAHRGIRKAMYEVRQHMRPPKPENLSLQTELHNVLVFNHYMKTMAGDGTINTLALRDSARGRAWLRRSSRNRIRCHEEAQKQLDSSSSSSSVGSPRTMASPVYGRRLAYVPDGEERVLLEQLGKCVAAECVDGLWFDAIERGGDESGEESGEMVAEELLDEEQVDEES